MHTPPKKLPPKARISRPMTSPTCSSSETSHVAPRAMETGKAVAAPATQPRGPSTKRVPGSPSRSTAPCTMGTRLYPSDRKRASPSQKSVSPSSNQSRSPSSSSAWSSSATSVTSRPSCIERTASSKIVGIAGESIERVSATLAVGTPVGRLPGSPRWPLRRCDCSRRRQEVQSRDHAEAVENALALLFGRIGGQLRRLQAELGDDLQRQCEVEVQLGGAAPRRGWPGGPGRPAPTRPPGPAPRRAPGAAGEAACAPPIASACAISASARAKAASMSPASNSASAQRAPASRAMRVGCRVPPPRPAHRRKRRTASSNQPRAAAQRPRLQFTYAAPDR